MGYFDEDTDKMMLEPAPVNYFKKIISQKAQQKK